MLIIGLMSGTSADGIDAALVDITGSGRGTNVKLLGFVCVPFEAEIRDAILRLCSNARAGVRDLCAMNVLLGEKFGNSALSVCKAAGISPDEVDAIASHGQTVWHQPE